MKHDGSTKILIVDDRPENLVALDASLSKPDRTIIRANSGSEALERMLEHDFAVVLLDVQMPEMDGFETAQLMRGHPRTRNVPIVFVTAISNDREFVFRGYESGAVDYLFKPLDPVILESKVRVFCDLDRQRRVIERQVKELEENARTLQQQLDEIKTLRGLLPICAWCKNIRNDSGFWETLETYLHEHSEAELTHGICPQCEKKMSTG